eukprot:6179182-Pleurochrysis_carterae.AAC.2
MTDTEELTFFDFACLWLRIMCPPFDLLRTVWIFVLSSAEFVFHFFLAFHSSALGDCVQRYR